MSLSPVSVPCQRPLSSSPVSVPCQRPLLASPVIVPCQPSHVIVPCQRPLSSSPVSVPCHCPLSASPVSVPCHRPLSSSPVSVPCHRPLLASHVIVPCQRPLSSSPVSVQCHCPLSASPVSVPCYRPLSASPVIVPCHRPLSASPVIVPCHRPLSASPVIVPCHRPLSASPVIRPLSSSPVSVPCHPSPVSVPCQNITGRKRGADCDRGVCACVYVTVSACVCMCVCLCVTVSVAVLEHLQANSERHSAPVDLLDWYVEEQGLILVLERPLPAVDLANYIQGKGGHLIETEAKIIINQLLDAAIDLKQKHVFHRDIKPENLLIETCMKSPRVRLIDFGLSCFDGDGDTYSNFYGSFVPPEWHRRQEYEAGPSTVYQIGVVLFAMLQGVASSGHLSFQKLKNSWWLSEYCKDFYKACMHDQNLTLRDEVQTFNLT
uniref:non-specific serine/threonine protein kinase n=1 Tax=Cyclopterus lumpus TaxID=8103 RepID=A0A8C3A7L4_CYCLU